MEQGPLPPHERTWRHPSEIAVEESIAWRTTPSSSVTRILAIATGAAGLLLIGVAMLSLTPDPMQNPLAVSTTATPTRLSSPLVTVAVNAFAAPATGAAGDADGALAAELPDPTELVTIQGSRPLTLEFGEIERLAVGQVDDGAAVLDRRGRIIGWCDRRGQRVAFVAAAPAPGTRTTAVISLPDFATTVRPTP